MRLEAGSSNSTSTTTLIHPQHEKERVRARRQTDPLAGQQPQIEAVKPNTRRSVDSAIRLPVSLTSSSPLSPDNLSNPAFAAISPRKINALKSPTRLVAGAASDKLDTPRSTRDHSKLSPATNNTATSPRTPLSSSSTATPPSLNTLTSGSSSETKSPHHKRGPASRSSFGIETSSGPPPALVTQRTYSQEKAWRPASRLEQEHRLKPVERSQGSGNTSKPVSSFSIDEIVKKEMPSASLLDRRQRSSLPVGSGFGQREKGSISSSARLSGAFLGNKSNEMHEELEGAPTDDSNKESSTEDSKSKSEDVFLNIARNTSSRRDSAANGDRKGSSKFGISPLASRMNRGEYETPSPSQPRYDSDQVTPLQPLDDSPSIRSPSAYQYDEAGRVRYLGGSNRSSIGLPRNRYSRTARETTPESPRGYINERRGSTQEHNQSRSHRHSLLNSSGHHRAPSISEPAERNKLEPDKSRVDGTESTMSTTAPSTVWDELDDLKSRIRKLELTGKLPASSAAAMSSVSSERPRTATTTMTTMSSSPKHGRKTSTPPPDAESSATASHVQPLLQKALAKAKPVLSAEVYRALETTAADATSLAAMLGATAPHLGSSMSVISGTSASDRQLRRKADSMCRSLTELCLALSDDQLISQPKRPESRDASSNLLQAEASNRESATPTATYRRSASHEPEELPRLQSSASRVVTGSRLESRRTSLMNINTTGVDSRSSQETSTHLSTPTLSSPPGSRLGRTSTTFRSRRLQHDDADERSSVVSRPLSRAMTEVNSGHSRYSRDRRSREYTSSHPLPDLQQQQLLENEQPNSTHSTPSAQSTVRLRKNYASPTTTSHLPMTPNTNIQPGFRRYGQSPSNAVAGNSTERGSNQATPEAATSTPKSAPHYSSIQQLRSRANSFGTRRISIRQRPATVVADGAGNME